MWCSCCINPLKLNCYSCQCRKGAIYKTLQLESPRLSRDSPILRKHQLFPIRLVAEWKNIGFTNNSISTRFMTRLLFSKWTERIALDYASQDFFLVTNLSLTTQVQIPFSVVSLSRSLSLGCRRPSIHNFKHWFVLWGITQTSNS